MSNPNQPVTHWTPVDRKLWLTKHGAPADFVLMTTMELAVVTNSLKELRRMANALQLECGRLTVDCAALDADKAVVDWLEANPIKTEIHGGSDDGHQGTFWGIGAHSGTLREAVRDAKAQGLKPKE